MKVVGVIAEYNPFHRGHQFQLEMIRSRMGADFIVAVMSGDFVQRGEPALFPKHVRAKMALACGADLVLELPVQASTASAEGFARGGVQILDGLGVVDGLCFGTEAPGSSEEVQELQLLAAVLEEEPPAFKEALRGELKAGKSFPAARMSALEAVGRADPAFPVRPEKISFYLSNPNAILGVEYCKALCHYKSPILPMPVPRVGSAYHEEALPEDADGFASASSLRRNLEGVLLEKAGESALQEALQRIAAYVPEEIRSLFIEEVSLKNVLYPDDFSILLKYRLLEETAQSLRGYWEVSEELANRIIKNRYSFSSFSGLCRDLKTKEITYTRASRTLLHILLGIRAPLEEIPCVRLLGFKRSAEPLLSRIKKESRINVVTKPGGQAQYIRNTVNTFASDLYQSVLLEKRRQEGPGLSGQKFRQDFQQQIIIL